MKSIPRLSISIKITALILVLPLTACDLNKHNSLQGWIEARYVYVSSAVPGYLHTLAVKRGQNIHSGELLYRLDTMPESSILSQQQNQQTVEQQKLSDLLRGSRSVVLSRWLAELEQAKANAKLAKQNLERYSDLYKKRIIQLAEFQLWQNKYITAKQQVNEAQANFSTAKLGAREHQIMAQQAVVNAAKEAVAQARWNLQQKTISSRFAGKVFDKYYSPGEYIPAGQPVLSLLVPQYIKVLFFIPETQLSRMRLGQVVDFKMDGNGKSYRAKVSFIAPNAEYTPPVIYSNNMRDKLVYRVKADMPVAEALQFHPGQPVDVYLTKSDK